MGGVALGVVPSVFTAWFLTVAEPAHAACSALPRHPCTPGVASVLRSQPYTPYSCSVFGPAGCTPQNPSPLNQVPVLRVQGHVGPSEPLDRDHPADRINEMGPLLSQCLELPPDAEVQPGMRVTLKLAFKRSGELLAEPRFTYVTHEAPASTKTIYRAAAIDMVKRCMPLPITAALGAAIAGRPFVIPIIETRTLERAQDSGVAGPAGHDPAEHPQTREP
jgi:hypothetical protein